MKKFHIYLFLFSLSVSSLWAQEEDKDKIGTSVVDVVKSYKASIPAAFKIKQLPTINDSVTLRKRLVKYSIYSVPVASTFTPAKGKASVLQKQKRDIIYNSSASLGLGMYSTVLFDFYTSKAISRDEKLDIGFNHTSLHGDIEEVSLDNRFLNTKADIFYNKKNRYTEWGAEAIIDHDVYNWYGIPSNTFSDAQIAGIDPKHTFYGIYTKGYIAMEDALFKGGELWLKRFWDKHSSAENRGVFAPKFLAPIAGEEISVDLDIDYVGGSFDRSLLNADKVNYSYLQGSITPSLLVLRDDLTLELGATLTYGMDMENDENQFYLYPQVKASYRLLEELLTAYAGVEGGLKQNSYADLADENPFVAPILDIRPSNNKHTGYIGLKGKLLANLAYDIRGSYAVTDDFAFFRKTPNVNLINGADYAYGNAFEIVYNNLKTLEISGSLQFDVSSNFTLEVQAAFANYRTVDDLPAWNLPNLKANVFADYQLGKHWFAGANIFFVGERDELDVNAFTLVNPNPVRAVDAYFDANAHLGYRFNDRLSIFARANNISDNTQTRWKDYKVQGFQILAGAVYKFDL
ncbi:MAG: TonB-dependent receptor [Flavobacteriaceae bacterium]|nr:TonB-dependent receptor [Flavobacteriaceae bacterium]